MEIKKLNFPISSSKPGRTLMQMDLSEVEKYLGQPARYPYVVHIGPGVMAGNHWHSSKREAFILLQGKVLLGFKDPNSDDREELELEADGTLIIVPHKIAHVVENVGEDEAILYVFATAPAREPDDDFDYKVF